MTQTLDIRLAMPAIPDPTNLASRVEHETLQRLLYDVARARGVPLGLYASEICTGLAQGTRLDLSGVDRACIVRAEIALPLVLIIHELVTNAVEHAHPTGVPGAISVACRYESDGTLVIDVCDDGVGLPEGFDPKRDGTQGFRVMRALAARLGATLAFDSQPLGLRCLVILLPSGKKA